MSARRAIAELCRPHAARPFANRRAPRLLSIAALSLALGASALGVSASGCGFSSKARACGAIGSPGWLTCALNQAPYRSINSDTRNTIYETPGLIRVRHGESCVSAPNAMSDNGFAFRIHDSESVPRSLADSGTIFMNGWYLRYTGGDHHLVGFGSAIVNINSTLDANQLNLSWDAGGVLSDDNGDDPYQWCYSYTIVFWNRNSSGFDAVAANGLSFMHDTTSDPGNGSALRNLDGTAVTAYGPGVVLPQGFALLWADGSDHHLLQTGFDLGTHYNTDSGQIAWTSRTLIKDNDDRIDYYGGELVGVLGYASPQTWHPAVVSVETPDGWTTQTNSVALTPEDSDFFCTAIGDPTGEQHFKVDNVPFQYAVPVLAGWELGYVCTDHHVRQFGAAITDFHYERAPDASTGTLYYTVAFNLSDDDNNGGYGRASVDIFGMNAMGAGPHPLGPTPAPPPARCNWGNRVIDDGAAVTAYASPQPAVCEPCESETRVCNNGTMSGSFAYTSCSPRKLGPHQECP